MAPLLGIHPTEINSSLREPQYVYATVCFTVHREILSTLTHIPLLWHKDRQGSSHSVSQITLVKAEVNKVWVHLNGWLDYLCCLHLPTFIPRSTKKTYSHSKVQGLNEEQTTILYLTILFDALLLLSFMPATILSFLHPFFSCPHIVLFLYKISIIKAPPYHSVFIPPQPHTRPTHWCMCQFVLVNVCIQLFHKNICSPVAMVAWLV